MKRTIQPVLILVAVAVLALFPGCASLDKEMPVPVARVSDTAVSSPMIAITYSPAFKGQTASGYLNLVVDMTIENKGCDSFHISPERFSVEVSDYSYSPVENSLQAVELSDGDMTGGKLAFQVPAVAATTRVGYRMTYSGQASNNIKWFKQADSSVLATDVASSGPVIEIAHQGSFMWIKQTSSLYLILDMTIENKGYESFNTSPEYFTLVLGHIFGQSEPTPPIKFDGLLSDLRDGAYTDMRTFDLQNGGKLNGTIAYRVPPEISLSTESYRIEYSGVRAYNIRWSQKPYKEQ